MSEYTNELRKKFYNRYEQLNQNIDKLSKAGRGLFTKVRSISSDQFNDLVSTGEKKDSDIITQVRETVQPLSDIRGSYSKAKYASVGLIVKARENGTKYFSELVSEGEKSGSTKANTKNQTQNQNQSKSKAKSSSKAA